MSEIGRDLEERGSGDVSVIGDTVEVEAVKVEGADVPEAADVEGADPDSHTSDPRFQQSFVS